MTTTPSPPRRSLLLAALIFVAAYAWGIALALNPPADLNPLSAAVGTAAGGAALWRGRLRHLLGLGLGLGFLTIVAPQVADHMVYGVVLGCLAVPPLIFLAAFARAALAALVASGPAVDEDEAPELPPLLEETEPDRLIVGLAGYAGAGKDTAAKALLWDGWAHASFAAKLKDFTLAVNPLISVHRGMPGYDDLNVTDEPIIYVRLADYVEAVGLERAKDNPEVRDLLQRTGTDAGRYVLGADVWVDAAMDDLPADVDVVFTDCRFPNEAAAIHDAGGYVIRVVRPGTGPRNAHGSETALDDYPVDAVIVNDGDMQLLGRRLKQAIDQLASMDAAAV